jgi:hypothetical protein
MIDLWYGAEQHFGRAGLAQRWVNILGRVRGVNLRLSYSLNEGSAQMFSMGPDGHRLARAGDFNAELDVEELHPGANSLLLEARGEDGRTWSREVTVVLHGDVPKLPHEIHWCDAGAIHDVAQIVDGRWSLTPDGIRILEPYYDRVIAVGDRSWTDYEVSTTVTFHGLRVPRAEAGDAGHGVIHAALAVRWPGHDCDGRQPHVKWYPLGATAEFRVNPAWDDCSWRFLGGPDLCVESPEGRSIDLETPYAMKHRCCTAADGGTRFQVKLWPADQVEPTQWDLDMARPAGGVASGGALLIAHYTDVTFGDVRVSPAVL